LNRPNPARAPPTMQHADDFDLDATDAGVSEPPWTSPCDPLRNKSNGGAMKVLAADSDTLDGWLGTLALVDELGRWPSGENYGLLRASVVPRNGQIIGISTASDDEANPLGKLRAQAMKVPTFRRDPENPKHKIATSKSFAMHEWSCRILLQVMKSKKEHSLTDRFLVGSFLSLPAPCARQRPIC